jgi:lipopolysaccharide export system protein LptA
MCLKLKLMYALLVGALLLPVSVFAKSGNAEQLVHVEADSAQLNDKTGIGVYLGDVRITQGNMVLTADKVTVIAPGRDLLKLIAHSNNKDAMSTFRQLTDSGEEITAEARHMVYEPDRHLIILLGDAVLLRGPNRFAAQRIVYHIVRQVTDAGALQGKGRVKMTLVPESHAGQAATIQ